MHIKICKSIREPSKSKKGCKDQESIQQSTTSAQDTKSHIQLTPYACSKYSYFTTLTYYVNDTDPVQYPFCQLPRQRLHLDGFYYMELSMLNIIMLNISKKVRVQRSGFDTIKYHI